MDWLADGRRRHDWDQTACLLAQLHNTSGFATESADPADYHPLAAPEATAAGEPTAAEVAANWDVLKGLVTAGRFR